MRLKPALDRMEVEEAAEPQPTALVPAEDFVVGEAVEVGGEEDVYAALKALAVAAVTDPKLKARLETEPGKLLPQHLPIVMLRVQRYKHYEIAALLNVSIGHVHRVLSTPAAKALLTQLYAELGVTVISELGTFADAAELAMDTIVDLAAHSDKPEVRMRAAFGILDRVGYGPTQKHEHAGEIKQTVTVTDSRLTALKQALDEATRDEVHGNFQVVDSMEQEPGEEEEEEEAA